MAYKLLIFALILPRTNQQMVLKTALRKADQSCLQITQCIESHWKASRWAEIMNFIYVYDVILVFCRQLHTATAEDLGSW